MEIASPVGSFQDVPEEVGNVSHVEPGIVFLGDQQQILGQRELAVAQERRWPGSSTRGAGEVLRRGGYRSLPMASSSGWTPAASTA